MIPVVSDPNDSDGNRTRGINARDCNTGDYIDPYLTDTHT